MASTTSPNSAVPGPETALPTAPLPTATSDSAKCKAAGLAVAVDEIGSVPALVLTADNIERLPSLSVVHSRSSFIDFPPGLYTGPVEKPRRGAGAFPGFEDEQAKESDSEPETPTSLAPAAEFEIYNRFTKRHKIGMSILMAWCGMLSSISSTAVLAAIPEVAAEFKVEGSIISLSNAIALVFMGMGPCFWGPMSQTYGRRPTVMAIAIMFALSSIGTALAPNLAAFFVFRMTTSFAALSFQLLGATVIGDLYHPTERARGLGWYLIGPLTGPSIAPFMGSIVITYQPWRVIFWVQATMAGFALVCIVFFLPETLLHPCPRRFGLWILASPARTVRLLRYPNLLLVSLTAGALIWNSYSLLTPIRYVLNPRFGLTSPIQSGFFFLAPGVGNIIGAFFGTRWADNTVRRWIVKRGNQTRIPEDRLRAGLLPMAVLMPAFVLVYGWSVDRAVGGIPVPAIFMVLQGVAQMIVFPTLDTYCLDVNEEHAAEILGGNFMIKFWFGAAGSAVVIPAIDSIGVGWFSTVSAAVLVLGGACSAAVAWWGTGWRVKLDQKKAARRAARARLQQA